MAPLRALARSAGTGARRRTGMSGPDRVDVAVIGAGIIGLSCAAWLQRSGRKPVLFDAAGLANGASFGTAGLINGDAYLPVALPGMIWRVPLMIWLILVRGRPIRAASSFWVRPRASRVSSRVSPGGKTRSGVKVDLVLMVSGCRRFR